MPYNNTLCKDREVLRLFVDYVYKYYLNIKKASIQKLFYYKLLKMIKP